MTVFLSVCGPLYQEVPVFETNKRRIGVLPGKYVGDGDTALRNIEPWAALQAPVRRCGRDEPVANPGSDFGEFHQNTGHRPIESVQPDSLAQRVAHRGIHADR